MTEAFLKSRIPTVIRSARKRVPSIQGTGIPAMSVMLENNTNI
jgi:hypothetical protein